MVVPVVVLGRNIGNYGVGVLMKSLGNAVFPYWEKDSSVPGGGGSE